MARPELPGAAVPHSVACSSISVGGSRPLFQPPAKNALLFFVWLWYIGLGIVKAALKSSIFLFFLEQLCYFNLSPQGDGNFFMLISMGLGDDFNLSPQGDGNGKHDSSSANTSRFQLIPARGRKHDVRDDFSAHELFQLIPARGRKPLYNDISIQGRAHFNLSPQGDGNQSRGTSAGATGISTYPRKGTETEKPDTRR